MFRYIYIKCIYYLKIFGKPFTFKLMFLDKMLLVKKQK